MVFRSASASLHEAEATLGRTAEVRPEDVAIAQAEVQAATASMANAWANVEQAYIRAPVTGRVLHVNTWPGERVDDRGVLDLAATGEVFAEAEVYETDLDRVHAGQTAVITSSVLKDALHGRVVNVGRALQRQQVVNIDPAANTDARVALVRVLLDAGSREAASHFINMQVRVEMRP